MLWLINIQGELSLLLSCTTAYHAGPANPAPGIFGTYPYSQLLVSSKPRSAKLLQLSPLCSGVRQALAILVLPPTHHTTISPSQKAAFAPTKSPSATSGPEICLLWATPTSLCNSSPSTLPPYRIGMCPRELVSFGFALHLFSLHSPQAERDCGQPWHDQWQLSWEAAGNGQQNCTRWTVIPGELQYIFMPSVSGRTTSLKSGENPR